MQPIASIEAVDDHTVRIRTAAPSPDLPTRLPFVFIMSEALGGAAWRYHDGAVRRRRGDYVERHADGTGPFRLESFEPGTGSVMTRNPGWWGWARTRTTSTDRARRDR